MKEMKRGYGAACLAALHFVKESGTKERFQTDIVLFLNADQSEEISEAIDLLLPIVQQQCDLVIGNRHASLQESGALTAQQHLGNWLVSGLVRWIWKVRCKDFGPFRAIRHDSLKMLNMQDRNFGWTVEMQVKAFYHQMRVVEVPVSARVGKTVSRISGTWRGAFFAAIKMLGWVCCIGSKYLLKSISQRYRFMDRYSESGP